MLEEPISNISIGSRAFCRSSPGLFNRLPPEVRQSPNSVIFKEILTLTMPPASIDVGQDTAAGIN